MGPTLTFREVSAGAGDGLGEGGNGTFEGVFARAKAGSSSELSIGPTNSIERAATGMTLPFISSSVLP